MSEHLITPQPLIRLSWNWELPMISINILDSQVRTGLEAILKRMISTIWVNRFFADIKGSVPVSNIEFSTRVRLQITKRSYSKDGSDSPTEYDGRIKLKGKYKIPHFPLDPYLSFEIFTPLFRSSEQLCQKAGAQPELNTKYQKSIWLALEYTYQRDNTPHLKISNLITVSYTYRF